MVRRKSLASLGTLREKLDKVPSHISTLLVTQIKASKNQPRRYFDEDKLAQLEHSIKEHGILEPLIVRPLNGDKFEVVAGERRLRASQRLGLEEVPVVVRDLNDREAATVALIENLQREDLNPFEETEGMILLLANELQISSNEVSPFLHRLQHRFKQDANNVIGSDEFQKVDSVFTSIGGMAWESFINNRLPLINLPHDVGEALRQGKIAYTKAKVIAQVKDEDNRKLLLKIAVEENLSLVNIKKQVKSLRSPLEKDLGTSTLKMKVTSAVKALNKSNVWNSPSKQRKIEKLLVEIENLLKT